MMRKQMGELLVDHTFSPGLPEEVAIAAGYDPRMCREGKRYEAKTATCAHCRAAVVLNPRRVKERYTCFKCSNHYICDVCAAVARQPDYDHTPFDKVVDLVQSGKGLMGTPFASANPPPVLLKSA